MRPTTRAMSSPSDLVTLPFLTRQSHVFRSNLVVDNPNTALPLKKQNLNPMWKKLMKLVDLGEPTSFLDHVYLGCTQCECKSDESILEQYKKIFESRVSTGATEQLLGWEKSTRKQSLGLVIWRVIRRNAWTYFRHWIIEWLRNCMKSLHPAWTPITSKEEELETVGELSQVCSQFVMFCFCLARIW